MERPSSNANLESLAKSIREGGPEAETILQRIPVDVMVILILGYLDGNDVFALCQTSKYFEQNFCSQDPRNVWQKLWHRDITSRSLFKGLSPQQRAALYRAIYLWLFGGFKRQNFTPERVLIIATRKDYEKYVASHLPETEKQLDGVIKRALEFRSLDVIKMLYNRGIDDNNFISIAAAVGDIKFVDQILVDIERKRPQFLSNLIENAVYGAVLGDQVDLFEELLERFPQIDPQDFIGLAIKHNSNLILKSMFYKGISADNNILIVIATYDDVNMAKLALQLGATDLNGALLVAAGSYNPNRLPMVEFLVDQGANNYQAALAAAQAPRYDSADQQINPAVAEYLEDKIMGLP